MWYYSMPESIVCQEGTRFSTPCQVKAPCGVKTNVVWYWSPENMPNSSNIIRDSSTTRIRALHSQEDSCTNSSVMLHHFYTLTLVGLSSKNVGFYWCQLEIIEERESKTAATNLLPSDKCHVGVDDILTGCKSGEHKDEWKCAQSQVTIPFDDSADEDIFSSTTPGSTTRSLVVTLQKISPTVVLYNTNGETPPIKMNFTVMEIVLFVVVLSCVVIIALLLVCIFLRRKRKRAGNDSSG